MSLFQYQDIYEPGTTLCDNSTVDAAAISPDGRIAVFKGNV